MMQQGRQAPCGRAAACPTMYRAACSAVLRNDQSGHSQRWHASPSQVHHAHRLRVAAQAAAVESSAVEAPPAQVLQPHLEVFPPSQPSRMINSNRGFVEEHRIRGYEVGPDQRTSMQSIANIIQEVASNHAVAMWGRSDEGFATDPALADKGLIFVMTRLQIQMDEYPRWGDVVHVETWFQPSGKIGAQRDFLFSCKTTGRPLGRATSSWVLINLHTRRLAKMPDEVRSKFDSFAEAAPARQAIAPAYTKHKIPEVDLPAEITGPMQLARRSDVDMNGHVNNVTYLAWALETVPLDIYTACHLYQLEIDFKAECHMGDLIESLAQRGAAPEALASNGAGPDSLAFLHTLRRCEGDNCTELVRMRTVWRLGERPQQ